MITYTHNEKEYKLRNDANEVNLKELGQVSAIMNESEDGYLSRWIKVVDLLGSKGLSDVISQDGLTEFINNFEVANVKSDIVKEIEVNGITYSLLVNNGEVELSAKEMSLIEDRIKLGGNWASFVFALIFKQSGMSRVDNFSSAHIEKKAKIFETEITADIASPIIYQLNKKIVESIAKMTKLHAESKAV